MHKFVRIVLPLALDNYYTYGVPDELAEAVVAGCRVVVSFGKKRLYTGVVVDCSTEAPDFNVKPILSVCDGGSIITNAQKQFMQWIAQYYCAANGDVVAAAIPSRLLPSSETKFYYQHNISFCGNISCDEQKIISILQNVRKTDLAQLIRDTDIKNPLRPLNKLIDKGLVSADEDIDKEYKPIKRNFVAFATNNLTNNIANYESVCARFPKQQTVIEYLQRCCERRNSDHCDCEERTLLTDCNVTKSVLTSLAAKGLISLLSKEVSRLDIGEQNIDIKEVTLSPAQAAVYNSIVTAFAKPKPVLLFGVTSSGKTEIYIKLIKRCLQQGRQVLYLLPEIALTSQIISRLQVYFGKRIAVFHSRYSAAMRAEVYKNVLEHKVSMVLGVRAAVFLPFDNLGLIVVDEEHETTYKQMSPDPRYHARDAAVMLAKIHAANVILGSATPSVESFFNAKTGKYELCQLTERYGNIQMPDVQVVDLKDGYHRRLMDGHFHQRLLTEMRKVLDDGYQVILFQNRRGFSSYIECRTCGYVPHCKNCNVSLTYHRHGGRLLCHYCGLETEMITRCQRCGSTALAVKGFGTERIEDEIAKLFPKVSVARLDYDTANSRKRYEQIIADFQDNKIQVLVGTQLIAKGLDFANLRLVGIMNADNMLQFPDFRAFERAFQLMMQVSGRAGRRDKRGMVIIQTFSVDHPIVQNVVDNDYASMFAAQIIERRQFKYPPFWNFIIVRLKHADHQRLQRAAMSFVKLLQMALSAERVRGPEEPAVNKISNLFIMNIHVRFEKNISHLKVKETILTTLKTLKSESEFVSIRHEIDVDPV